MPSQFKFEAIGTKWVIDIWATLLPQAEAKIKTQIQERIAIFDKNYSRFRKDSLVAEMSRKTGEYRLPADAGPMLVLYKELYDVTGGLLTPLVGQTLVDAGYDASYSLEQKKPLRQPPRWEEVMELIPAKGDEKNFILKIKTPGLLDFGAAGKGYLIDIVGGVLEKNGIQHYCVDAGGDMRHRGEKILQVGLENPENIEQVIGVTPLFNQALAGSAGNRRVWKNFHHIIDPMKLASPRHILALWVKVEKGTVVNETMLADALATCLFFVTPSILLKKYQFEYLILYADHSIEKSEGWQGEVFSV
ncbi:MAG: FAD:protein FMN transferase [Candidatus Pacebacteria bacterium]|nr:FAD:protein FMN transferase [Candidatus Paceibacterota bacterium]